MSIKQKMKELFKSQQVGHISERSFINFELRLYVISLLQNDILLQDGWSVFTQYFYEFISQPEKDEIQEMLYKLRFDGHIFSNQGKWSSLLQDYLRVPAALRIYEQDEQGYIRRIIARYENKREEEYRKIIEQMQTARRREVVFADDEDEIVYDKKKYSAPILPVDKEIINPLEEYADKKYVVLREEDDWKQVLSTMGEDFINRPDIQLKILGGEESIQLKGMIHIVGALGAGKSTFKYAQVVKGIKEYKLKIAMVEESVSHVIETVNVLRNLGINAVPLIGSSNERKYLERYLTKFTNYIDLTQDEIVKDLSGSCIIKGLAEDRETPGFPCNKLFQGNERVSCNYCDACGHMSRFRKIADAQVIVTTPHNLVKGNLITPIDSYERSIYEMLHDLMDMIIVDEADGVQSILEDQLMVNVNLNYGEYSIIQQFNLLEDELEKGNKPMKRYDKYKYINNCKSLDVVMVVARRVLIRYTHIHCYILNKCLTPVEVFNEIKYILMKEKQNEGFISFIEEYVKITDVFRISEEKIKHRLHEVFERVRMIHLENGKCPELKLKEEINTLLAEYRVTIPKNDKGKSYSRDRIIEEIGLLVILVQIDYLVKLLANEYSYLYYELHQEMKSIDGFTLPNKKLSHLIKEPCIGSIYGYKISFKNELQIDILRYAAVGRSMLERWPYLKEEIGIKGPAIICLSGTSHSPGSAHYHLKKEPDILLLGKKEGKIEMHFCPQVENAEYIRVSGSGEENKSSRLKSLSKQLAKLEIKNELASESKRKILMIVNSYDDAKTVGDVLDCYKFNYRVICNDPGEHYMPKESLESFEEESEGADICVVPLTIIARGYNILNKSGDSYFGCLYFLIRPYMVPGDFSSYIQILHYSMGQIADEVRENDRAYTNRIKNFRKRCFAEFSSILNMRFWKGLTDRQREVMTWFMLIPMKQAIGRMQRNGNDCKVYFCDSAFCDVYGTGQEMSANNSTLYSFYQVLGKYKGSEVLDTLYHEFYMGLSAMIVEIENQNMEELEEEY